MQKTSDEARRSNRHKDTPPRRTDGSASQAGADRQSLSSTISKLAAVLAPTTVIAALMYYFGWVRVHAFYAYFGIDADELGLSNTDYILRSAPALWPALVAIVAVIAIFLFANRLITPLLRRSARVQRIFVAAFVALGLALSAASAISLISASSGNSLAAALGLATGFSSLTYAHYVSCFERENGDRYARAMLERSNRATSFFLALLILLSTFWVTAVFADTLGQSLAEHMESAQFDSRPDVILYSASRIHLDAHDVCLTDMGPGYSAFRFRYAGLKLLVRGNGRLVVIPYSWSTTNPYAIVLPESPELAVVFAPNFTGTSPCP